MHDERELFKMLTLETFQAGLSWTTIWQRRVAFSAAFAEFDVDKIARFDRHQVEQLMANSQIIRNHRKIMATINNAQRLQQIHQDGKTLDHFLWSFVNGQPLRMYVDDDQSLPSATPVSYTHLTLPTKA